MPLGLVMAAGRTTSRVARWTTGGVLLQAPGRGIEIIPIRQPRPATLSSALQSKPLLVERGAVAIRGEDSRFNRSAIGLTRRNTLVVAGAFDSFGRAVTLKEFATFLVALGALDNVPIETALAMDGGPGAQLYFPAAARHYGDSGTNYVPNLVYLGNPGTKR